MRRFTRNEIMQRLREQKAMKRPIIIGGAGVGAGDPYCEVGELVDNMMNMGFSGITNVPTAGVFNGWWRQRIDQLGAGYPEEIKMVEYCSKKEVFSVAYAFNEEEVRAMVAAGVDVISGHVGATTGGVSGFQSAMSMDEAVEKTQRMCETARKENPDVFVVAHGGPFEGPKEVQECFNRTEVDGFIGASSIERLPVERAVMGVVQEFKSLKMK